MMTHQIVAYLISLAVGYWVLTLAGKEKGNVQKIGKVIGWIIIAVSLAGPLCLAVCHFHCQARPDACSYSAACPWTGHGMADGDMGKGHGMMGGQAPDTDKAK